MFALGMPAALDGAAPVAPAPLAKNPMARAAIPAAAAEPITIPATAAAEMPAPEEFFCVRSATGGSVDEVAAVVFPLSPVVVGVLVAVSVVETP